MSARAGRPPSESRGLASHPSVRRAGTRAILSLEAGPRGVAGMSSPEEVSVWPAGFGAEGEEQAGVRPSGPRAPWAPGLGQDVGPPRSSEGEGGLADAEGFESESESEREVLEAGRPVLWGREGRPASPADDKGDAPDYAAHLVLESAAGILQQLAERDALGLRRNPSPESCAAQASGGWVGLDAGPSGRGALARGRVESQWRPAAARLRIATREVSRAWEPPGRGAKSRAKARVDRQRLPAAEGPGATQPSDPESSDEFGEMQLMRVSIYSRGGGLVNEPSSPKDPGDSPRHPNLHVRENFLHVPGPFLTSAPRGFASVVERQAVGEPEVPSSKKMPSVVWGKAESRPSYQGATAAAAAAAAAGGLPQATPRRRTTQEKKSLGGPPKVTSGRSFPSWGQRVSAAPLEPATFPPISGVPPLGKSKKYSLGPSGTKQSKHTGAGKKSGARRMREAEVLAAAAEGNDSSRDAVLKGQVSRPCSSSLGALPSSPTSLPMLPLSLIQGLPWVPLGHWDHWDARSGPGWFSQGQALT